MRWMASATNCAVSSTVTREPTVPDGSRIGGTVSVTTIPYRASSRRTAFAPPTKRPCVARESERPLAEIDRRRRTYLGDRPRIDVTSRIVLLVDDGIATGSTMRAAILGVRRAHPKRIVGVLAAIFPHTWRIGANVARIARREPARASPCRRHDALGLWRRQAHTLCPALPMALRPVSHQRPARQPHGHGLACFPVSHWRTSLMSPHEQDRDVHVADQIVGDAADRHVRMSALAGAGKYHEVGMLFERRARERMARIAAWQYPDSRRRVGRKPGSNPSQILCRD
jgi:hypothetical protein